MGMCCKKKTLIRGLRFYDDAPYKSTFYLLTYLLTDWVKKCMEYEVEGSKPRGRPKRIWREVVQKFCQACTLNRQDAMDRSRQKTLIKIG